MRRRWIGFLVAGLALALSLWAWPRLPATIPTHWDINGDVNGTSPRAFGAFLLPGLILGLRLLFAVLPKFDPKRANYPDFIDTYWAIANTVFVFLGVMHGVMIATALGHSVDQARLIPGGLGLLFIGLGNVMTRVRPNWFVGIRTPWTLSSEAVWRRTHRLGGWTMVGGGVVMLLSVLLPRGVTPWIIGPAVATSVLIPVVYSYLLWKKEAA